MQSTGEFNPFTLQGLFLDSLAPGLQSFNASAKQDTESYSAFVQATYDLSESTSLTGGLRWTNDDRELTENGFLDFGVAQVAFPELKANDSWDEPTWRLALDHQLNDNALVFASYNRGFKSGAYATSTAAGDLQLGRVSAPVDPEILDAYEVGFKVDFPESALRLNGALFFYEYENLQFERVEGGIASILNAAEAEILGAELEMNWLAADKFEIRAGLSYIDGEYTEFPDAPFTSQNPEFPFGNATTFGDASGNSLVRTPDYTFNIGGVYTIETAMGILALSGQYAYNDGFPWEVDNRLVQESYDIVNAEVSLASRDDSWRVRLFGKNLFGEEYSIYSVSASFGDTVSPAAPRTWGVSVGYNF